MFKIEKGQIAQVISALQSNTINQPPTTLRGDLSGELIIFIETSIRPANESSTGTNLYGNLPYFSKNLKDDFEGIFFRSNDLSVNSSSTLIFHLAFCIYIMILEKALLSSGYNGHEEKFLGFYTTRLVEFPAEYKVRSEIAKTKLIAEVVSYGTQNLLERIEATADDRIEKLEEVFSKITKAEVTVSNWNENIEKWDKRAKELEDKIKTSSGELNFVGLSSAFSKMIAAKEIERNWQVAMMFIFGIFLVIIPLGPLILSRLLGITELWSFSWIPYSVPFVVLELIFLYFFRIFVNNFYSVKAQLLQLQLRYHICAFIEGYSEFAEKARKGNDDKLFERFELLIFNGISPDPNNVPTQFDGLEQIAKMFKDLKS
nr:hypothetical protein [uncultured Noviherbaspirillum sp.]